MGRYYNGDIKGKFWLATQPSSDAEQFGAYEDGGIHYVVSNIEPVKARLQQIFKELDIPENYDLTEDDVIKLADAKVVRPMTADERKIEGLYASLNMGLKIYNCLMTQDTCEFVAET